MPNSEKSLLDIQEDANSIVIRVHDKLQYNINKQVLQAAGIISPGQELAYIFSQDHWLLQLFVEDWKRLNERISE